MQHTQLLQHIQAFLSNGKPAKLLESPNSLVNAHFLRKLLLLTIIYWKAEKKKTFSLYIIAFLLENKKSDMQHQINRPNKAFLNLFKDLSKIT